MLRVFQDSDPPANPRGLVVCISMVSTHGDAYYIGLNGIELYDEHGERVPLAEGNLVAQPSSLNELPDVQVAILRCVGLSCSCVVLKQFSWLAFSSLFPPVSFSMDCSDPLAAHSPMLRCECASLLSPLRSRAGEGRG